MQIEEVRARFKGVRASGSGFTARCPAHDDRNNSLSVDIGARGIVIKCHAGCDTRDVLKAVGLDFADLSFPREHGRVTTVLRARELSTGRSMPRVLEPAGIAEFTSNRDDRKRIEAALLIWKSAISATGTLVETYLASRGLHLPPPPTIRFRPGLKHASGGVWPAMVGLVTRGVDDTPVGIQRTFLVRDGVGKAPVEPQKMMLGPCRGGAVRLGSPDDVLMVGEGIETCLAAMQATGNAAWAALSTSGLRALDLPDSVRDVIVLADGDAAGEVAALDCARRWKREGRRIRIARPPQGQDFNDLLMEPMARPQGGVE